MSRHREMGWPHQLSSCKQVCESLRSQLHSLECACNPAGEETSLCHHESQALQQQSTGQMPGTLDCQAC